MSCHPALPLLLTTSHQSPPGVTLPESAIGRCRSELILWKVEPVGPLSKSGGVTELTRLTSPLTDAFTHTTWLPALMPR